MDGGSWGGREKGRKALRQNEASQRHRRHLRNLTPDGHGKAGRRPRPALPALVSALLPGEVTIPPATARRHQTLKVKREGKPVTSEGSFPLRAQYARNVSLAQDHHMLPNVPPGRGDAQSLPSVLHTDVVTPTGPAVGFRDVMPPAPPSAEGVLGRERGGLRRRPPPIPMFQERPSMGHFWSLCREKRGGFRRRGHFRATHPPRHHGV